MLRSVVKIILRACLSLVLFLLLFLAFSWLLPLYRLNSTPTSAPKTIKMMVVSNGVHTDIAVPVRTEFMNWQTLFPPDTFDVTNDHYYYIAFGWGDKGFYLNTPTWSDLKLSTAIKAVSGFNETAMHVRYVKEQKKDSDHCQLLLIDSLKYSRLIACIKSSFQKQDDQLIKINHPGYGEFDRFYEANGHYSLFNTCNNWTCAVLGRSGLKVACWSPLAGPLLGSLK